MHLLLLVSTNLIDFKLFKLLTSTFYDFSVVLWCFRVISKSTFIPSCVYKRFYNVENIACFVYKEGRMKVVSQELS